MLRYDPRNGGICRFKSPQKIKKILVKATQYTIFSPLSTYLEGETYLVRFPKFAIDIKWPI